MRVMGVHATASTLWLACADADGQAEIGSDYRVELPKALESGPALEGARDDISRIIARYDVGRVWLLSAEYSSRFKYGYGELVDRITMETVVAFSAASRDVEFLRVARPTVRTRLGVPTGGKLHTHAESMVRRQDPHWGPGKRDLAAMTARAGVLDAQSRQAKEDSDV